MKKGRTAALVGLAGALAILAAARGSSLPRAGGGRPGAQGDRAL